MSHGEEPSVGVASLLGSATGGSASAKKPQQKVAVERKKLLFVHFAINRVHCRVTYKVI